MKNFPRLFVLSALLLMPTVPADIIVYNQDNPPTNTNLPAGGWGSYRGFSINFSDAALDAAYTAPDSAPLAPSLFLNQLTVRHSGNQGGTPAQPTGDWTQVLLKVYTTQVPTTGSFVGDSINILDMSYAGVERNETFLFNNLPVNSASTYYFYFSNTAGNVDPLSQTFSSGRLRVSNNASHTYTSGNLINPAWGGQDTAYDPILAATFTAVPEPSSLLLLAAGGLLFWFRRR